MNTKPRVDAVAGIIRRNGRILITRRARDTHLGGLWEFPGGKIETGESPEFALIREVREELGLSVRVAGLYLETEHIYSDRIVHIRFFDCSVVDEVPTLSQIGSPTWVKPADLEQFAMPEANQGLVEKLIAEDRN